MSNQNKATLSVDLNSFIYGVSRRNFQNAPELTKIGIGLLKNFPAARDAVLEYFAMVFHDAVNISLNQEYEPDSNNNGSLESVSMIGPELCNLGESWAPFIAPWCINLIMDIATEKANLPNATLQNTDPIRILLDITTQNLTLLNSEERAKCIDMMLGCRACSWAVGLVGRAEPALVAPRALALAPDAARAVLAHLANHPPALYHVRAALVDLFQEAIREDGNPEKKREVIPYLLNLASKSDIVLKALTQDIENTLTDEVVARLQTVPCRGEAVSPAALVALLMRCDARCYLLLLRHAQLNTFCRHLLEQLLQKLEYENLFAESKIPLLISCAEEINILREKLLVGNRLEQYSIARILILVSYNFPSEFVSTISYLLQHSRSDTTLALLVRIISGTSNMHIPNDEALDTERYQEFVKTGVEYALRDAMIADTQIKKCFIENVPNDQKTFLHHLCLNIITLLRWENSGRVPSLRSRSIARAVESSVYRLGAVLRERACELRERPAATALSLPDMPTCHALAQVLDRIDLTGTKSPPPSVEAILKVVQATVKYFFRCLLEDDVMQKVRGVQTACGLFRKVCGYSKVARNAALRDLLEAALFRYERVFTPSQDRQDRQAAADDLLLYMNRKHGPITQLTQSHTSVFHAGVIGKGARKHSADDAPPTDILTRDNELLMGALMACMEGNSGVVEGATSVSLLLVELISPDVMYNGLPWPDEDFTKQVSIERELYTRVCVERCGVARSCLRRCGRARPALCLSAALLRAAAASLLHRLRAHLDRHTQSSELSQELAALKELLTLMTLGQLLPHPLSHMLELAPELTATETVQVLRDCLWNYTRDHVPTPALFACDATGLHWRDPSTCKPPAQYTDTLRLIIQKRISKLGHMYPIMFLNLEKET
ncbi:integrator complex subunit 5 isoform X2 [Danaus plexippus]|uniref:integrator complex subunit 5 isoform X2 n=1 Tax=Danaus plexippus TaxID=13037 RepID=UPI002AAF5CE8|nr:integrator complex subunit 5 isoform X2 [Danaus plexippus]